MLAAKPSASAVLFWGHRVGKNRTDRTAGAVYPADTKEWGRRDPPPSVGDPTIGER